MKNGGQVTIDNIANNPRTGADAGGIKTEVVSADVMGVASNLVRTFVCYGNVVAAEDTALAVW